MVHSSSYFAFLKTRKGFTVIELTLFAAIFAGISIIFLTLLVVVTRIQLRQSSVAEVNSQSQFLLQTIQRQVEQAALIDLPADTASSSLKLRMQQSGNDPTYIFLNAGTVYLRQTDAATAQPLTSNRVLVSSLAFTKRTNVNGRDAIAVAFTMDYNAVTFQQQFSQILNTSIARVTAATFDSNIRANTSNTYSLGTTPQEWQSINSTLYFSGSNVGVNVSAPGARLQVSGGDVYVDTVSQGLILRSPNGNCFRVAVSNGAALSASAVSCP